MEKTPSFFVSPARQLWHCFGGCSEGGDIFKFVMKMEGVDFPEALRMLAERAGVKLAREDPALRTERYRLQKLCEEAAVLFERTLSLTSAVKVYLRKRGLTDETMQLFRIGYAPPRWNFLVNALAQKGFRGEEIEKAGLAIRRGQVEIQNNAELHGTILGESAMGNSLRQSAHGWYDRFRGRIMFSVADHSGKIVGFGGRVFDAADSRELQEHGQTQPEAVSRKPEAAITEAKYINTPQTPVYDKSRILYGFDKAKQEIRSANCVVLVEGYMDCVLSHQAGVKNTVAVSGTALTAPQLQTLKRLCDTVKSSFDADAAGDSATRRSLALAAQYGFERLVVQVPSGKDPADTVQQNPEAWQRAVAQARPVVAFYFDKGLREHDARAVEGKKAISRLMIPLLAELSDEIERAHWVIELSRALAIPEHAILAALRAGIQGSGGGVNHGQEGGAETPGSAPVSRRRLLEERMMALFARVPQDARREMVKDRNISFSSHSHEAFFRALVDGDVAAAKSDSVAVASESAAAGAPELTEAFGMLQFRHEVEQGVLSPERAKQELTLCLKELERECIKEQLVTLGLEIQRKEQQGNREGVVTLLHDFRHLSERLKGVS